MKFYKNYWRYFFISAIFLVPAIMAWIMFGLRPGIDFTGGTLITVAATEASESALLTEDIIRSKTDADFQINSVKRSEDGQVMIRLATLNNEQKESFITKINEITTIEVISYDSVGATLGSELIEKTMVAIALACIFLVIYLRARFKEVSFGAAAFLGVVHDTLIISGIFCLLGAYLDIEVDTLFVTALLTTISFSVHDTVVIYDRIRELKQRFPQASLVQICEAAVTATFSRSLNNSLTVVFMLAALLLLGGVTLRYFALALLLGVIFGTYSSPFVSVPLLLLFDDYKHLYIKNKQVKKK